MGEHEVPAPWWDGFDEVGGELGDGGSHVHVDKVQVIIGSCGVGVYGCSS
jgi:hypothetical protein